MSGSRNSTEFEIEVERAQHDFMWTDDTEWSPVPDGSLRNDGMEFITPPVRFETLGRMAREYYAAHDRLGYEANIRTGIHVHADMRWRTLEQVAAICAVYAYVEPLMFEYCGAEREECIYCVPWYRAPDDAILLGELLRSDGDWRHVHHGLERMCKYGALYLEPLRRLGTIEFRAAPTYENPHHLMTWVALIKRLVLAGTYYGTPERVMQVITQHPSRLVQFVFQGEFDEDYALTLLDECDTVGVVAHLVRTRPKFQWVHKFEEPMENPGSYFREVRPVRSNDLAFVDEFEADYDDDDDYDEEDY